MPPKPPLILLIGHDPALAYLIERYAERSGYEVHAEPTLPSLSAARDLQPATVLFSSIGSLEAAQTRLADLAGWEIPLLVCSSVNDQARARELGADYCLVHPLTFDGFLAALTTTSTPSTAKHLPNRPEETA
jgi:DNA-binding response OmpR family regulator